MNKITNKYTPEVRELAVRMVLKNISTAALSQDRSIVMRKILRAAISVTNTALWRRSEDYGHVQCLDRQIAFHAVTDGPADHTP